MVNFCGGKLFLLKQKIEYQFLVFRSRLSVGGNSLRGSSRVVQINLGV
jgi:hypothetical protein